MSFHVDGSKTEKVWEPTAESPVKDVTSAIQWNAVNSEKCNNTSAIQ